MPDLTEAQDDSDGRFNEVDEARNTDRGTQQRQRQRQRQGGRGGSRRPMTAHQLHVAHVEHVRRVKGLQKLLNKLGLADLAVDGKFGPDRKSVV